MPVSVVHSARDEEKWAKAKKLAGDAGRPKDYAYVMGIYKKMKGLSKAIGAPQAFYASQGRIPTKVALGALRESQAMFRMPEGTRGARMLDETTPRLTIDSITRDLGMDPSTELVWRQYLGNMLEAAPDEVSMRQTLYDRMREARLDPYMRKAILVRSLSYFRHRQARKSLGVATVDELYKAQQDAHTRFKKAWNTYLTTCGQDGCPFESLSNFVGVYGADTVAEVLEDAIGQGECEFDGSRFRSSLSKAARFVIVGAP